MFKAAIKRLSTKYQMFTGLHEMRKGNAIVQAQEYARLRAELASRTPDSIALEGYKVYSQTDEDGIIDAIAKRIGGRRTFVEIGVQGGVECNSLLLLLKGWRGSWIEGSDNFVRSISRALEGASFPGKFRVTGSFVDSDNIGALVKAEMAFLDVDELDLLSIDIDGNDLHCLARCIDAGVRPRVLCVEYNAKFPPGVAVTIEYRPDHVWDETDYMGSSLQAFVDLLGPRGYRLIACNIPGINAFFVREDLAHHFPSLSLDQLYQPFRYFLSPITPAQPPSLSYLRAKLRQGPAAKIG